MNLTEISLAATTLASGIGWLLTHFKSKRAQDLADEGVAIATLEKIIKAQDGYIETLNKRMTGLEQHFEQKCKIMQAELDQLKKKLTDISV